MELSKMIWTLVEIFLFLSLFLFQDVPGDLRGILFYRDEGD